MTVNIKGMEGLTNGRYLIIRLRDRRQINYEAADNYINAEVNNANLMENSMTGNEDIQVATVPNPVINYSNFISIFQTVQDPEGLTFQEIKSYLYQHNFPINTKQLKKFLQRGLGKKKILLYKKYRPL